MPNRAVCASIALAVAFVSPYALANRAAPCRELAQGAHQLSATALHPGGMFSTNQSVWFTNNAANEVATETFDAAGQITKRVWKAQNGVTNHAQTLEWDLKGRLWHVQETNSQGAGFDWFAAYDPLSRRAYCWFFASTNGGSYGDPASFLFSEYDPAFEFLELGVTVAGKTTWKLCGPDQSGRYGPMNGSGALDGIVEEPGVFEPVLSDARGNLAGYWDPAQAKIIWNSSRPTGYGAVPGYRPVSLGSGGNVAQSAAWRGRSPDLTGYVYLGARYYNPESGTFLSADPTWNSRDPNYFTFCGGDPINYFDADGRLASAALDAAKDLLTQYGEAETRRIEAETSAGWQLGVNSTTVYDRARADGASRLEAAYESESYLAGSFTGFTPLYEGAHSYDIAGAYTITDPVDRWTRITLGTVGVAASGWSIQSGLSSGACSYLNDVLEFSPKYAVAEGSGGFGSGYGPVYLNPPPGATPAQIQQMQAYVNGANEAITADALSTEGRVPTQGDLRDAASALADAERARAAAAGTPYRGHVGHVPDTTWMGTPEPFMWLDLDPRVNLSIGGQANRYPFGYVPTEFILRARPGGLPVIPAGN